MLGIIKKNRISPWKKHIQKVIQHKDLGGHSANYPERHPFSAPSVTWIWQLNFQGTISKSNRPTKQPPLTTWYHPIGTGDFCSENGWTARFFSSSLLMSFFIFLKVLQLFLFCLFQMEKKTIRSCSPTHPAIFLYTTHIYVYIRICNMYMWLYTHIYNIYICIITSSGYMLVIHLRFQGLPHRPTREAWEIFVGLGTHRVWKKKHPLLSCFIHLFFQTQTTTMIFTLKKDSGAQHAHKEQTVCI